MLDRPEIKETPFKVPEGYFEQFGIDIMGVLPEKESFKEDPNKKRIPLAKKVSLWVAVAAVFLGVIFYSGILHPIINIDNNTQNISSSGMAYTDDDDYFIFLEEEIAKAKYKEMIYNN